MNTHDDDKLIVGHDYDGIQELNNPLPNWWQLIFYGSIIFAFFYTMHYEFGSGLSSQARLNVLMEEVQSKSQKEALAASKVVVDYEALLKDPQAISQGKAVFVGKCAPCHGPDGGGVIGPNLTDKYWIHGDGKAETIADLVRKGVPDKGMPPWDSVLTAKEVNEVTAYVKSIAGTKPQNPKAPQGNEVL